MIQQLDSILVRRVSLVKATREGRYGRQERDGSCGLDDRQKRQKVAKIFP